LGKTFKKKDRSKAGVPDKSTHGPANAPTADIVKLVWELADPICIVEGIELVHIEYQRETGGRILRLYIDQPGGITFGDCSKISSQLGDILDLKLETYASYTLEVSSPGIDRPVSRLSDFNKFTGESVNIKISAPLNGQKNFKGILSGVFATDIHLKTEKETVVIPYQDIIKARLVNYDGDNKCL